MNRHRPRASLLRWSALLLAGSILAGCSLKQANPAKQSFLLEPVRIGEPRAGSSPVQLRVRNIHMAAPFEGKGFVYRTSDLGYKVDFYNEFLTAPRTLIAGQLQAWLGTAKVFRAVLPPGIASEATHTLDGNVSALYGDFRIPAAPKAVVEIEIFVTSDRGAADVVFHRSYRQEISIAERLPEALAKGWSLALEKIFTTLEADMATAQLK